MAAISASMFLNPARASAERRIIPGAIRWDAWYTKGGAASVPRQAQRALSTAQFQARALWFSEIGPQSELVSVGTQTDMDLEIQLAAQAGIRYWAFAWDIAVKNGPQG